MLSHSLVRYLTGAEATAPGALEKWGLRSARDLLDLLSRVSKTAADRAWKFPELYTVYSEFIHIDRFILDLNRGRNIALGCLDQSFVHPECGCSVSSSVVSL